MNETRLTDAVRRAEIYSPFLRGLLRRHSDIPDLIAAGQIGGVVDAALQPIGDDVSARLRIARQRVALAVALADLSGIWDLRNVVETLSLFADYALDTTIRTAIEERYGGWDGRGFSALALGKHGSRELNYSSDIDPILLYEPSTLPHREREDVAEAAVRIARRVVEILQRRDENGYVLRVDLRLRPSPEATTLALPVEAAIGYYEASALPWERAAFIRARAAAGDLELGRGFLDSIRPFIWRRSLDFGTIREIRGISSRIRDYHAQHQLLGPGYDLKRGRGGIREVEFYAQIHQLIHGGREPALRAPATLDALAALAQAGRIPADEAEALAMAYTLYRTVEHRLQMVDDAQTHLLPANQDALDNVARLGAFADGEALISILAPHVDRIGSLYDGLDRPEGEATPRARDLLEERLREQGFTDPAAGCSIIEGWRTGRARALRSATAMEALETVLPSLIACLGAGPDPNIALLRFDSLVSHLPSAVNLFRLLEARPVLLALLGRVLAHAPTLADALARRAELLDGLIDATALAPPPPRETLIAEFGATEPGDDYQAILDQVRQRVGERRFAIGVQIIEGASDPVDAAQSHARVAEAAIEVLTRATIAEFEKSHGHIPGGELVILALGRLGGGALTHASDLDLIYLFTGDFATESVGARPTGATTYFNRLAQRVTAALSVPTASGPLYEVDTRLRPSGAQGLLAVSLDSFAQYQSDSAWIWEHMALTRARPVFGSAAARGAVARVIDDTLHRPRDADQLVAAAVKMRGDIATHKPPASPFDVKLISGGLVDCEFTIHVLQLIHGIGLSPRLRVAASVLAEAGLLDPAVVEAHAFLTRLLVTQRLVSPNSTEPPDASKSLVAHACRVEDWPALLARLDEARHLIAGEWRRVAGLAKG